mgnify:CR=1 FL=1
MRLNIRKIEKRLLTYRRDFLRTARFLLESGLELVERYEETPSLPATAVHLQSDDAPVKTRPTPKKGRKKFDKDMVNGAMLAQHGMVGANKIHRRTVRHH